MYRKYMYLKFSTVKPAAKAFIGILFSSGYLCMNINM